jgi:exportin-2 (importin alpha re-exporter)
MYVSFVSSDVILILHVQPDDATPSLPSQIKTGILDVAEVWSSQIIRSLLNNHVQLFIKLYPEQLPQSPIVESLVQAVWNLIGSNKLPGIADDSVRCSFASCAPH